MLTVKDLYVEYKTKNETVHAVNGVSFDVAQGEILAIAGESGSGKSTVAKALMHLIPIKSGEIEFRDDAGMRSSCSSCLSQADTGERPLRMQIVFQNPYSSLNPKMKILDTLAEPLKINTKLPSGQIENIVRKKIALVGLNEDCLSKYPHEFSGGQRQRIAIARALVTDPSFIIADEPVSALDVSIQAQIINLIKELKNLGITFIFISHDLSVIRCLADRTAVMHRGKIVEIGSDIFTNPQHEYTKALLDAVPQIRQ
jgi:ABC-type oligopeptide transport system ATPase subunit